MLVVTHTAPDMDAALGTWLFARYMVPEGEPVLFQFVPAGTHRDDADAVIDTGRVYDPRRYRYDHHMPEWAHRRDVCAASLVYEHALLRATPAQHAELVALRPLVDLVTAGDHGRAPDWSYETGPHAIAASIRAQHRGDDHMMLTTLHQLIDDIASSLWTRDQVRREAAEKLYPLGEGIALIRDGSALLTRYALDTLGYEVVVFVTDNRSQQPPTLTVGIQRANESTLDCGAIADAIQSLAAQAGDGEVVAEVQRWYRHPAGFFAGRGTAKAPDPTPITERALQTIAALLVRVLRDN